MKDQGGTVVERSDEIFGAPGKAVDAASAQLFGEVLGKRMRKSGRRNSTRRMRAPTKVGVESAPDGFDLGQFGHFIPFSTVSQRDR